MLAKRTHRIRVPAMIAGMIFLAGHAVCPAVAQIGGRITTDGTAGPRQSFSGPQYQIPASAGREVGTTLFHSFFDFSVGAGETVTFSGPDTITRVIARVTGGTPSQIDGTITTSGMPLAHLYLINPAGITFGATARIDVPQSFTATTADWVRLSDGTIISSSGPQPVLTSAPPVAFGFLSPQKSTIKVGGSTLEVTTGKSLALVSSAVQITQGAKLIASDGRVQLVAVGDSGTATVDAEGGGAASLNAASSTGPLVIDATSTISTDGVGAGRVDLIGQQINLEGMVTARTDGLGSGAQIDVYAVGNCTIDGGQLSTLTTTPSPAGAITVQSGGLLKITNGGQIKANTLRDGAGGLITLTPHDLLIDGAGTTTTTGITAQTGDPNFPDLSQGEGGSIVIRTHGMTLQNGGVVSTVTFGQGNAGGITVSADTLQIASAGQILAQTGGSGTGGAIGVFVAKSIQIMGQDNASTGILADTTMGSAGAGGQVAVVCQTLDIQHLGVVSTTSNGSGPGGAIQVTADSVVLNGSGLVAFTGLGANTQSTDPAAGKGGDITVTAQNVQVLNGAGISAITFGPGKGGEIVLNHVQQLTVDGGSGNPVATGIYAKSLGSGESGAAGTITIHATDLLLKRGGVIDSASVGAGDSGAILVDRGSNITMSNSTISVSSAKSNAGNITLNVSGIMQLSHSTITAQAALLGGQIRIDPAAVILNDHSLIDSIAGGHHDAVRIGVQELLVSQNSHILTDAGIFTIDTQLASGLAQLLGSLAVPIQLQESCFAQYAGSNISTFTVTGRGGLPIIPAGALPSFSVDPPIDTPPQHWQPPPPTSGL